MKDFGVKLKMVEIGGERYILEKDVKKLVKKVWSKTIEEFTDKIKSLYEEAVPHGLYNPSEASDLQGIFAYYILQYYNELISKLGKKKK